MTMDRTRLQIEFFARRNFFALAAGIFLVLISGAQTASSQVENRWLFIFDTSAGMKSRVPAVQYEINSLFSTSMSSQLHIDDTIGVWTFDEQLHTRVYPLTLWVPEDASIVASNMNKFIGKQHYANSPHLDVIAPMVTQLVKNSTRLTVLIFCDGESQLNWTPYTNGVNQVFTQWKDSQKKQKQPFVVVLRSQLGEYIGCTANFPPGAVKLLQFPPLPPPPKPTNAAPPPPPQTNKPPPVRMAAPLIIVGTKVQTNWPPPPKPATTNTAPPTSVVQMAETNVPSPAPANVVAPADTIPPAQPVMQISPPVITNANVEIKPPPPQPKPQPTNAVAVTQTNVAPAPPVAPANAASPPEDSGLNRTAAFAIGAAALLVAAVMTAGLVFRARRKDRGSLISRSMRKP
jgi:hypothetical protein